MAAGGPGGSASGAADAEEKMLGAALQLTCSRVCDNLRDAIGLDGCSALIDRAITLTEERHPLVRDIRRQDDDVVCLDGVMATAEEHGIAAVGGAVDALLAALLDVLARLIGEDMARRLMDIDTPRAETDRAEPAS